MNLKAPEDLVCQAEEEALKWKMWSQVLQDGLCNEALKVRHWAKIYKTVPTSKMAFAQLCSF